VEHGQPGPRTQFAGECRFPGPARPEDDNSSHRSMLARGSRLLG
jgi:hypothetical protein